MIQVVPNRKTRSKLRRDGVFLLVLVVALFRARSHDAAVRIAAFFDLVSRVTTRKWGDRPSAQDVNDHPFMRASAQM